MRERLDLSKSVNCFVEPIESSTQLTATSKSTYDLEVRKSLEFEKFMVKQKIYVQ